MVPVSPFISASLTFKNAVLKLEVGMGFKAFHNGSISRCPIVELH